jgi:hypothetical protein
MKTTIICILIVSFLSCENDIIPDSTGVFWGTSNKAVWQKTALIAGYIKCEPKTIGIKIAGFTNFYDIKQDFGVNFVPMSLGNYRPLHQYNSCNNIISSLYWMDGDEWVGLFKLLEKPNEANTFTITKLDTVNDWIEGELTVAFISTEKRFMGVPDTVRIKGKFESKIKR